MRAYRTVAKAVTRQSCVSVSLTVAMALCAKGVQVYWTVAKACALKLCERIGR